MRFSRRSRLRSSRGHVRIEPRPRWMKWAGWALAGLLAIVVLAIALRQFVLPSLEDEENPANNRTWLEFAWTLTPVNEDAVRSLGERLESNGIDMIYLEASAWRSDGTLLEGEFVGPFVESLRAAYPAVKVLLWLRMSVEQIADPVQQSAVIALADKAVHDWQFDGVQLNGRSVRNGNEAFVLLLRDLRAAIGDDAILSVTVPPDRIPTDPDVPIGPSVDPELTWDVNYKQRVALLLIDEVVLMAHASGLEDTTLYEQWVAYQVTSYASALAELDQPADIIVALPTYDAAPEHDPEVESIRPAIRGVKAGIARSTEAQRLVKGVGLFEYKTTDSLEWALFGENWLGVKQQ